MFGPRECCLKLQLFASMCWPLAQILPVAQVPIPALAAAAVMLLALADLQGAEERPRWKGCRWRLHL